MLGLAAVRQADAEARLPEDEPFQLFRGFNEIFITAGLLMFAGGLTALVGIISSGMAAGMAVLGLASWFGAEYLTRRRRMILPSIALACLFVASATQAARKIDLIAALPSAWPVATALLVGLGAGCLFYWRFRLPFTLFLIGAMALAAALISAGALNPEQLAATIAINPWALLDISVGSVFAWIILALGVAGFALAMRFDMADPRRVTRRAACGFWLHLLAGPAMINTLAIALLHQDSGLAYAGLLGLITLVVTVSIVIDRRSFMLSAIGYLTVLIANVLFNEAAEMTGGLPLIVLCLGTLIVALGAGWSSARGTLMRRLPGDAWKLRLPPYAGGKD